MSHNGIITTVWNKLKVKKCKNKVNIPLSDLEIYIYRFLCQENDSHSHNKNMVNIKLLAI